MDEDGTAPVHGVKEIEFIAFIAKHTGQSAGTQHIIEAIEDLLPGIVKGFVKKLRLEKPAGDRISKFPKLGTHSLRLLQKIQERINRGARHDQQKPRQVSENNSLFGCEIGS